MSMGKTVSGFTAISNRFSVPGTGEHSQSVAFPEIINKLAKVNGKVLFSEGNLKDT